MLMAPDVIITIVLIAVGALILHLKSHVKFIGLGMFVGIVLAQTVSLPIYEFLAERFGSLNNLATVNVIQLTLLLVPTVVLGINHSHDKKTVNPVKTILYVAVVTTALLGSVLSLLPDGLRQYLIERSFVALQLYYYRNWLVVALAILIVVDSFSHKKKMKADKVKSGKKK